MNGIYRHFKGNEYQVYGKCVDSSNKWFVLYKPLYNDSGLWIRDYDMFFEKVERDGNSFDRFSLVKSNEDFLDEDVLSAKHSETLERFKIKKVSKNEYSVISTN